MVKFGYITEIEHPDYNADKDDKVAHYQVNLGETEQTKYSKVKPSTGKTPTVKI